MRRRVVRARTAERRVRRQLAEAGQPPNKLAAREDELLDEALEETFPASDPIAPFRYSDGKRAGGWAERRAQVGAARRK